MFKSPETIKTPERSALSHPDLKPEVLTHIQALWQKADILADKIKEVKAKPETNDTVIHEAELKDELANIINNIIKAKEKNSSNPEMPEVLEKIELSKQYETQVELLKETGLINKLDSGEYGISGIDDKEYELPTMEEIITKIEAHHEKFKTKIEQGFIKLLIVPFGRKLSDLTSIYSQTILDKHASGQLFSTNGDTLELDINEPLWVWDEYAKEDNIVYFPKKFKATKEDSEGKTKLELLKEDNLGFQVLLIEDSPDIPVEGEDINGRKQIGVLKNEEDEIFSPSGYLELLQKDKQYEGEQGLTAEAWLTHATLNLKEKNQVIDDYRGSGAGKACYNLATYFPASSDVSRGSWVRDYRRAYLSRNGVSDRDSDAAVRPSVNIF